MGINSVRKNRPPQQSKSPAFQMPGSGNVSPFRATGRGFFNKLPSLSANESTANASLTNLATSKSNGHLYKTWIFVNAIETGWKLSGQTGQAAYGRVFYPQNLTQDEISIEGICASQYEYDRLMEFVQHHHFSQIHPQGARAQTLDGDNYPSVLFNLHKPYNAPRLDMFPPLQYGLVIQQASAGHERFKNVILYNLICKVTFDYLGPRYEIQQDLKSRTTRQQIFGNATTPNAGSAHISTAPSSTVTTSTPTASNVKDKIAGQGL